MLEGKNNYLYQVQGETVIELQSIPSCDYNCTTDPITATIKTGYVGK